jgi:hypothetical protein
MCAVVDASTSNGGPADVERGVLANLPRTRPQRATARRAAARNNAGAARRPRRTSTRSAQREPDGRAQAARRQVPRPRPEHRATRRAPAPARRSQQNAPPQGFACEESSTSTLHPPGGAELVVSAAELVGDLAKAGISRGERLVKDLFGRLPLT